jgi:actin-related protein
MRLNREKIAEFIFERLGAPNVYFLKNPVLSCFATGKYLF